MSDREVAAPTVLFLCPHNALRSVIATALFEQAAGGQARAESAGTEPDDRVDDRAVQVLREVGLGVSDQKPARVTPDQLERADRVVSLGCSLEPDLAALAAGKLEEWPLPSTTGQPLEAVRELRELLRPLLDRLLREMGVRPS